MYNKPALLLYHTHTHTETHTHTYICIYLFRRLWWKVPGFGILQKAFLETNLLSSFKRCRENWWTVYIWECNMLNKIIFNLTSYIFFYSKLANFQHILVYFCLFPRYESLERVHNCDFFIICFTATYFYVSMFCI